MTTSSFLWSLLLDALLVLWTGDGVDDGGTVERFGNGVDSGGDDSASGANKLWSPGRKLIRDLFDCKSSYWNGYANGNCVEDSLGCVGDNVEGKDCDWLLEFVRWLLEESTRWPLNWLAFDCDDDGTNDNCEELCGALRIVSSTGGAEFRAEDDCCDDNGGGGKWVGGGFHETDCEGWNWFAPLMTEINGSLFVNGWFCWNCG